MVRTERSEQIPGWLHCDGNDGQRINSFALVTYIPDPLGCFLDSLRRELVPACIPRAHVTILPPRPLALEPELAWKQMQARICERPPFEIEATEIRVFDVSSVVYIAIGKGLKELLAIHDALNCGDLGFPEPFSYQPHITLAQELPPERVTEASELAGRRWAECPYRRSFSAEVLTFVQNTTRNEWLDLAQCTLNSVPSVK